MKCVKCGQELPEGTKFCTSCGAPQTEETPKPAVKEAAGDVVILAYDNLTSAINAIRRVSDAGVPEARKLLSSLPVTLFEGIGLQRAAEIRQTLKEYGITVSEDKEAEAQAKAEADAKAAEEVAEEMDAFIKSEEMQNMNLSIPSEEPEPAEEPETEEPAEEPAEEPETEEPVIEEPAEEPAEEPVTEEQETAEAEEPEIGEPAAEEPEAEAAQEEEKPVQSDADFEAEMQAFLNRD